MSLADKLAKKNEEEIDRLTKHYEEKKNTIFRLSQETKQISLELEELQLQLNNCIETQLNLIKKGGNPFK